MDRGARIARADLSRAGADLRAARVTAGLSLASVGSAIGLSASQLSRIERAVAPATSVVQLARIGAVVGLDVRVRTFPGPDPVRDAAHIRLLQRCRQRLHPTLTFRTEVPLAIPGDQRAWDARIGGLRTDTAPTDLPLEAETRIGDLQAQARRVVLKMRDAGEEHVLLVVADTRSNRAAVAAGSDLIAAMFPVPARRALAALAAGRHPGGSALVFL